MEAGVSQGEASAGGAGDAACRRRAPRGPDGELSVLHATRRAARGSAFPFLSSGGGWGARRSSTPDLALELSVLVHGGGGRIRSSSFLSVEGPIGVKQGRRGGSLKAAGGGGPLSSLSGGGHRYFKEYSRLVLGYQKVEPVLLQLPLVPMGDGQIRTSDRDERMICHIVNTAEYYHQTVEDLQRQLESATKEQEALIDIFSKERNHHVKIF
ncbi:unnamed protein product [Urochloa humidicola]